MVTGREQVRVGTSKSNKIRAFELDHLLEKPSRVQIGTDFETSVGAKAQWSVRHFLDSSILMMINGEFWGDEESVKKVYGDGNQNKDNLPLSFHDLDYIPECDADDGTIPLNTILNAALTGYREQCMVRDSITTALWADQGNIRR
ncbi:response regulator [Striga asiatica]|uniref:Response regulator n=1 Tax=Striga asiatica TaxID=4170 RepID=A0A5A7P333_STRAF|nr:response regulator [Striga asiatica]